MRKYKAISLAIILCCSSFFTFAQDDKKESPVDFDFSLTADYVHNTSGGIKQGGRYLGLIDAGISFDTEKAKWWKGGSLYLCIQNTHGGTPSKSLVGDMQVLSNIENGNYTYLHLLEFKQQIGHLSLIAGLQDYNAEFNTSDFGALYTSSSFGIMPSISLNMPVPIFPKTALGLVAMYKLNDLVNFKFGVFDGNPDNLDDAPYNLKHSLSLNDGALICGEAIFSRKEMQAFKVGFNYHTAETVSLSDTSAIYGNFNLYAIIDQPLFKESADENQGLGAFMQIGIAPSSANFIGQYIGFGLNYKGLISNRDDDDFGIAVAYAGLHKGFHANYFSNETAIETTYNFVINDYCSIQPTVHYIIHPGADRSLSNATVGLLRLNVEF